MEKAIKLIITEEASEFSQESNAAMQQWKITTLRLLSAQKTEKNC